MKTQKLESALITFLILLALSLIYTNAAAASSTGPFRPGMTPQDAAQHCSEFIQYDAQNYACTMTDAALETYGMEMNRTANLIFSGGHLGFSVVGSKPFNNYEQLYAAYSNMLKEVMAEYDIPTEEACSDALEAVEYTDFRDPVREITEGKHYCDMSWEIQDSSVFAVDLELGVVSKGAVVIKSHAYVTP